MSTITVTYELDQWEWQGTQRSIEIDSDDYLGMSAEEIKEAVYTEIRSDADQHLHFVYAEDDVVQEVLAAAADDDDDEDSE